MRKLSYLPLFFLLLLSVSAQSQKLPKSLLWRITGNGLNKPSYLYGTMHLTDERLFELGDSLYNAIEQTEGFAMEVNPEELSALLIDEIGKKLNDGKLVKDMIDETKFKQYQKALSKKFNKPADKITSQDVLMEKNRWMSEKYKDGKMTTALDAYLYDVARRQGKWTGGIEDIADQSGLLDELIDENDIKWVASEGGDQRSALYVEAMIQFYLDADLNSIDSITNFKDSAYIDALLTKRNIKMARRMDSLSSLRSMTFAVGAAHLPGKLGVIQLLKSKGFVVEPVFYAKTIVPEKYTVKEVDIPWVEVADTKGFYTAKMPGKAGDIKMFGIVEMKMFYDIFSNSGFFTTSMVTPYDNKSIDSVVNVTAGNFFGFESVDKSKPVAVNGIKGKEWEVLGKDGYKHGYILNNKNIIYIAVGYALKKTEKSEIDIKKFLAEYKIFETSTTKFTPVIYADSVLAFSVEVPSKVEAADNLVKGKDTTMNSHMKVSIDNQTGTYYMFGINEVRPGYYIENDSTTLENIRKNVKKQLENVVLDTIYMKDRSRVLEYGGRMKQGGINMRTYYQFRGNRWYALVVLYNNAKPDPFIDRFFSSFKLLNYPQTNWDKRLSEDGAISAWVPGSLRKKQDTSIANSMISYRSFDSTHADSYSVFEQTYDKYVWYNSDSALWESITKQNVNYNDTLLHKAYVYNGKEKGLELLLQQKNASNVTRKRIWVRGNKLYYVSAVQPQQYIRSNNTNKFFEELSFNKPATDEGFIYRSKTERLLNDLLSKDSVTKSEAASALRNAPFSKTDLPSLHDALLKKYDEDESAYGSVLDNITSHIIMIHDTASLVFAKKNYATATDVKVSLLNIISSYKTKDNYREMKELILSSPPEKKLHYKFKNNLDDTLALTASIIKDLLPLYKDTIFADVLVGVTNNLVDSGLLLSGDLKKYHPEIIKYADYRYNRIKRDSENYNYSDIELITLLGKLKTTQANAMLQKWLDLSELYLVSNCVEELLDNKQPVPAKTILKLASDDGYRIRCYELLKKRKKLAIFPKQYLTQKAFARAVVHEYANEDDETPGITFLSQKTIVIEGKKKNFYFFKVGYKGEEREFFYTAGVGPFSVDISNVNNDDASVRIFDGEYDAIKVTAQINELIGQFKRGDDVEELVEE